MKIALNAGSILIIFAPLFFLIAVPIGFNWY